MSTTVLRSIATVDPVATVERVTPAIATAWLASNHGNRNIRSKAVALLARDMAAGDWRFTGEAIKFDADGTLLDGQHRLMAVVQSGAAIDMLIIRGLDRDAQRVMDSGAKRSAADALGWGGHKNTNLLAAAARLGLEIERDDANRLFTHSEVVAYVDENPDLLDVITAASAARKYVPMKPAAIAYSWLLLSRVDARAAASFFDALINNATDGRGDPRNTLLRRLATARQNKETLRAATEVQFVVRAWNAWRRKEELHVLRAKAGNGRGGTVSVQIPEPR